MSEIRTFFCVEASNLSMEMITGSWNLQSFMVNGKSWGESLQGILVYTQNGIVSVAINRNVNLPNFSSPQDCLFYAGKFSLKENVIEHDILVATDPEKIGRKLFREAHFESDDLLLSGVSASGRKFLLRWRRI